ncbi:MAG: glycosyltransferase family 4 protein [Rhizobiales bacterium]|nr:glycosyltransferase family 4 protein [Hyphomicrobiales bacterium]
MSQALAIDLTRLFVSLARGRPRGIERVDLDYCEAALRDFTGDVFGIIAYPWGPRMLERGTLSALVQGVRAIWAEDGPASQDAQFDWVRRKLTGDPDGRPRRPRGRRIVTEIGRVVTRTGLRRGRSINDLPRSAIYLNVGQVGFAVDRATAWLNQRRDVRVVSFLHDLLPLHSPEWFKAGNQAYFGRVLDRLVARSDLIVVSTETTADQLRSHLERHDLPDRKISVRPLAPSAALGHARSPDPELSSASYMMMCGTIEARKNHILPLLIWRDQLRRGVAMPKLLIAGQRGWGAAAALDLLDRSDVLKSHVVEASRLSTPALMHLMSHARAVLVPSWSEGYGLPLAEALTLGVPVIASDIPVFREVAQDSALLTDLLDGPQWRRRITALSNPQSPDWMEAQGMAARYRPALPIRMAQAFAELS